MRLSSALVYLAKARDIEERVAPAFPEKMIEMWFGEAHKADFTSDTSYRVTRS